MSSKKILKTTLTNKQYEKERRKGTLQYQLRLFEEQEAEQEIKDFRIPPCVGHAFEPAEED